MSVIISKFIVFVPVLYTSCNVELILWKGFYIQFLT